MTALALHILGAVVWVGGMFAIYVCLRPGSSPRAAGYFHLGRIL
jgi:uncharacterized membrane protein